MLILKPPCYNTGQLNKVVSILNSETDKKLTTSQPLSLEQLEMFARLSGMYYEDGVYYSANANEGHIILINHTTNMLSESMLNVLNDCVGTIKVRGRLDGEFRFCRELDDSITPEGLRACKVLDLSELNTDNMTSCFYMFSELRSCEKIIFNNFNTSNVEEFGWMFAGCTNLQSLDLSNWRTDKLNEMSCMFNGCVNLKYLDLLPFIMHRNKRDNFYKRDSIFAYCRALGLENIKLPADLDTHKLLLEVFKIDKEDI